MVSKKDSKTINKLIKSHNQRKIDDLLEECRQIDYDYFKSQIITIYKEI